MDKKEHDGGNPMDWSKVLVVVAVTVLTEILKEGKD